MVLFYLLLYMSGDTFDDIIENLNLFEMINYINNYNKKNFFYDFVLNNDYIINNLNKKDIEDIENSINEMSDINSINEMRDIDIKTINSINNINIKTFSDIDGIKKVDDMDMDMDMDIDMEELDNILMEHNFI
jgi:predicted MPP superfamily phosphohydrolase